MQGFHRIVFLLTPFVLWFQVVLAPVPQPPVINAHESIEGLAEASTLLAVMAELNIQASVLHAIPKGLLFFSGDSADLSQVEENNDLLSQVHSTYPDQFSFFCTIDPKDENRLQVLKTCWEDGAIGVKLYNGYTYSHDIPLDDPRLSDLYQSIAEKGALLMLPVNTGEYKNELENLLVLNPELTVICPHYCLASQSLGRLTQLMEDHPNLYVDTGFGSRQFVREGFTTISENKEAFQDFFKEFQDRIIFGTDAVLTNYEDKDVDWLMALYIDYEEILTRKSFESRSFESSIFNGLDLPYSIQLKVFSQNWLDLMN